MLVALSRLTSFIEELVFKARHGSIICSSIFHFDQFKGTDSDLLSAELVKHLRDELKKEVESWDALAHGRLLRLRDLQEEVEQGVGQLEETRSVLAHRGCVSISGVEIVGHTAHVGRLESLDKN